MTTLFPSGLDTYTDPSPNTRQDVLSHSKLHDDIQDAMRAVQTLLGINGSSDPTTIQGALFGGLLGNTGASLMKFSQLGTGAVVRNVQDELRLEVRAQQFGALGDGVADDSVAIMKAIAYLQVNADSRGGRIKLGRGIFKCNATLAFTAYAAGIVHNIEIVGDGPGCTALDFSGAPASSDGITFNKGAHFAVRDLTLANARRDGLSINVGATTGGPDYCSMFEITNVRIQGCIRDGVRSINAYLGTFDGCWSKDNGGQGFNFGGFHTALRVSRCEASGNAIGWSVNGVTYAAFDNCGSDENDLQGWAFSNVQGVVLNGCGSESNGRDGFFAFTSNASAVGLNAQSSDVHGLVMNGCYALSNSLASPGTYATFLGATTADGRPIDVKIIGGAAHPATASDKALNLAGASGLISVSKDMLYDATFSAADGATGSTEIRNFGLTGRRAVLQMLAAPFATTSGAQATVAWDTTAVNELGATIGSSAITIPRGVNRIRVTASVVWAAAAGGSRYLEIQKNGAGGLGIATSRVAGVNALQSQQVTTMSLAVVPGDAIRLQALQDSGGALNINNNGNSYLCVEVLG